MREITITEKNIAGVYDKINRFFRNSYIKSWHNFDCGLKKHIKPYYGYSYYQPIIGCHYYNSGNTVYNFSWITIILDTGDRCLLNSGDKVIISSSRITIRQPALSDDKYLYQVFEKIEEGEFRKHHGSYRY